MSIEKIQAETNTIINIEEEGEFGIVDVASQNKEDIAAALKWIPTPLQAARAMLTVSI